MCIFFFSPQVFSENKFKFWGLFKYATYVIAEDYVEKSGEKSVF